MICHLRVFDDWEIITIHRSKKYYEKIFPKLEAFWNESLLLEIFRLKGCKEHGNQRACVCKMYNRPPIEGLELVSRTKKRRKRKLSLVEVNSKKKNLRKGSGQNCEFTRNSMHGNSDFEEIIWYLE